MQHVNELRAAVSTSAPRLHALSDRSALRSTPGKWSAREIIGRLVDSATNNYERFVRAQTEDHFSSTETTSKTGFASVTTRMRTGTTW